MKVTIEFTTDSYEYQVLKNDEFFEENYKDNDVVMDLVERLHNSTTYEEREEIAEELWEECGYDGAARMLGDGRLEVTYKKSDEEDIYVRSYEVLDNDWVDFDDYFEEDIKKSSFCIVKNSYAKRAHYFLETELDEPFSGEFLKIADGGISYKDEEMEFTGDAGGWIEESGIYVMGSSETEDDESDDEQVDIGEVRTSKLEELFADEIKEYERRRKEIFDNQDAQLISLWKECNIPDNGEKSWEELLDEDDEFMRKRDVYLQRLGDDDARVVKFNKGWESILSNANELDSDLRNPMHMDALSHYNFVRDVAVISAWDESTKQKILSMQKQLDELEDWKESEKIKRFTSKEYLMYEYWYDEKNDKCSGKKCEKWDDVDPETSIKKYMESLGEDDYESEYIKNPKTGSYEDVKGEDYEKLHKLIDEWRNEEESIDDEYQKKRNGIIHNDDNY